MITTKIGKIEKIRFGFGGYQDVQLGVTVVLSSGGWCVGDFKGFWAHKGKHVKWSEMEQKEALGDAVLWLRSLLMEAGKTDIVELVGAPIEVTFDDRCLKSWRILTEAL